MIAVAETWPEVAIAVVAALGQAWLAWLAYRSSKDTGRRVEDSTVLTRSTDTTPDEQARAMARREDDQ